MLVLHACWFVNLTSGEYKCPKIHSKRRCFDLKRKLFVQQSETPSILESKSSHIWNVSRRKMWCLSKKIVGALFEMFLYWFSTRNSSASTTSYTHFPLNGTHCIKKYGLLVDCSPNYAYWYCYVDHKYICLYSCRCFFFRLTKSYSEQIKYFRAMTTRKCCCLSGIQHGDKRLKRTHRFWCCFRQ